MRPRGLRARLVVVYTGAAAVVIAVFALLAAQALDHSLGSTLDSALAARATPFLQALSVTGTPDLPSTVQSARTRVTDGLVVVIDGSGAVRYSEPIGAARAVQQVLPEPDDDSPTLVDRTVSAEDLRLRVDRVTRSDGTWTVVVGIGREPTAAAADRVQDAMEWAGPALLIVVAAGTWLLAGAALKPVERMRAQAASLGASDTQARLSVPDTADELNALGVTFNDLLDRLHHSLQQQRDFVADAGHELRTPLAIMCAELELADRPNRTADQLRDAVTATRVEANRLKDLAEDLLLLAATGHRTIERVDLTDVVAEAVAVRLPGAERSGVRLEQTIGEVHPVMGESAALRRALDNLLSNALDHTGAGGRVEIRLEPAGAAHVRLAVIDTGPGFPAEFLPHAFDRFRRADTARTSQTARSSAGLGLSIVAAIVASHGGTVHAANNTPSPGACVALTLPIAPGPRSADSNSPHTAGG